MMETANLEINEIDVPGYEKVIHAVNAEAGLNCFIAIHNTTLGPALGGIRIFPYESEQQALDDALRLSKAMTYKSALAETGLGGGKAVIIAHPETAKTRKLLYAFAEVVETLKGEYIAAEDLGSTIHDLAVVNEKTRYVAALPTPGSSGDPSRFTARGVYWGIKAAAKTIWGTDSLEGKRIAIQGLGNVGAKLARHLFWEGAILYVSDLDEMQVENVCHEYSATHVAKDKIVSLECEIFSPCAMGRIINEQSIQQFQCQVIAGSANNQLEKESLGQQLMDQKILYAPDFVINAGGIINASVEFTEGGYSARRAMARTNKIYETLLSIFDMSHAQGKTTNEVAIQLAEYKLKNKVGKRQKPILF